MHDITSLVLTLALPWDVDHVNPDMDKLHAKAQALVEPFGDLDTPSRFFIISKERADELEKDGFLDYEGAARAEGWSSQPDHVNFEHYAGEPSVMHEDRSVNDSSYSVTRMGWKLCCEENDIEPLRTPFRIDRDFDGLIVWARP